MTLPIRASGSGVNIVQYLSKLHACCAACRTMSADARDDYEFVLTSKGTWSCHQCNFKVVLDPDIEKSVVALYAPTKMLEKWVAAWIGVAEENVKVSIDGES